MYISSVNAKIGLIALIAIGIIIRRKLHIPNELVCINKQQTIYKKYILYTGRRTFYSVLIGVDAKPPRKIVGGEDAGPNEFPWMARLEIMDENGENLICGGAIISARHILTAGHCVYNRNVQRVWTGYYIRDISMDVESFAARTTVHPLYSYHVHGNSSYTYNDIAIVTVSYSKMLFDYSPTSIRNTAVSRKTLQLLLLPRILKSRRKCAT